MSLFKNMTSTQDMEKSEDRLGGFSPLNSDIYIATVKNFFAGESKGGAMSLTLIADVGGGKEYRETVYITNKQKENYFIQKGSGKKSPLPGFTVANDICLIATGKELNELETEEKIVKVWDPETKTEQPKSVPVVTEVIGQKVALGILRQLENKNEKGSDGEYHPTPETRESNIIDKVFHPEAKMTVAEARDGKKTSEFWDAWLKKNQGQTRDRRELKDDGKVGGKSSPPTGGKGEQAAPRKSLFGK